MGMRPATDRILIRSRQAGQLLSGLCLCGLLSLVPAGAQDNSLDKVHVTPTTPAAPAQGAPKGAEAPAATGPESLKIRPGALLRMNVDLVLVPVTVTDPMNRLVTGLEQEDFQVFENNGKQEIRSFASEDAPVSIGIILDLSGSMTSKLARARESIRRYAPPLVGARAAARTPPSCDSRWRQWQSPLRQ